MGFIQMPKASYVSETQIVLELASDPDCRYIWTQHFLVERREKRKISQADIQYALTIGHVELVETNKKDILWRVVGNDVDGRRITVLVAVYPDIRAIKIVTAF